MKKATQDDYIRTALRLPRDLHSKVQQAATRAGRTLNAELIARIAAAEDQPSNKELLNQNEELKQLVREVLAAIELLK